MRCLLLSLSLCLLGVPALAAEAKISKTHICCGGCVSGIEEALGKVEGLTEISVDKDAKTISFQAADKKMARQGVRALNRAGFGGEATVDGKALKPPAANVEKGTKADEVKLTRLHLCCPACTKAVQEAVSKVEGVASVTCDEEKGTCTATGKDVEVLAVLDALQKAGFNGTLPGARKGQPKKKKQAN
jgi:periplasmic mercuric ion binding protein